MKGHRDRRDPESCFSAEVCALQLSNPPAALVCGVPRLLVETGTDTASVLPAVRNAGAGNRRTLRRVPARRPRLRLCTLGVAVYRSHARHPASFQVLGPRFTRPSTGSRTSRQHGGGRFPRIAGLTRAAPPRAGTRAGIQPGRIAGAASRPCRRLQACCGAARTRPARRVSAARSGLSIFRRHSKSGGKPPDCVLVVDDVYTTGATLHEIAKTLKRAGTSRVEVLTVARVLRQE